MVVRGLVRRHPLIAFFVLAYVLTWWIYPLLKFSPLLGLFGLVSLGERPGDGVRGRYGGLGGVSGVAVFG
jgi:hypothetical protein